MQAAMNVQDVMSKDDIGNTTDKLEGQRSQSSISVYTEVFKKADLV